MRKKYWEFELLDLLLETIEQGIRSIGRRIRGR